MRSALSLLLLAGLAAPSVAVAQGDLTVTISNVTAPGGRIDDNDAGIPFNQSECDDSDNVMVEVSITGTTETSVDIWVGSENAACEMSGPRDPDGETQCFVAVSGANLDTSGSASVANITLANLDVAGLDVCSNTAQQGRGYRLYVFDAQPSGDVTMGFGFAAFEADITPPDPPNTAQNENPVTGDETITVGWNEANDASQSDTNQYNVYAIAGACDGMLPETGLPTTPTTSTDGSESASISSTALGLNVGDTAQVFVTAEDNTGADGNNGNESEASAAVCIQRVETSGFCDAAAANGDPCSTSCSVGWAPSPGGSVFVALAGLGLLIRRRRRG